MIAIIVAALLGFAAGCWATMIFLSLDVDA